MWRESWADFGAASVSRRRRYPSKGSSSFNCADIRSYQDTLKTERLRSLDKLSQLDQELGLGYE